MGPKAGPDDRNDKGRTAWTEGLFQRADEKEFGRDIPGTSRIKTSSMTVLDAQSNAKIQG